MVGYVFTKKPYIGHKMYLCNLYQTVIKSYLFIAKKKLYLYSRENKYNYNITIYGCEMP